ncbi:MAG: tetratricopeptide repeat protein [Gammaproteobacteria bacterium]
MTVIDFNKARASKLHETALRLDEQGCLDDAIRKYQEAIACDPLKVESHYNLGLLYKYAGEWQKSFDCNKTANTLDPNDAAARWNLAIAATALRNWDTARKAWQENGLAFPGSGPIEADFGITPVRLHPCQQAEVVWARRIDPVRARIESIPLPESGFRYADVVLHDGAAVGYRKIENHQYPVFNVLELFEQINFVGKWN